MEFYEKQDERVKVKIQCVFEIIKQVGRVPKKLLEDMAGTDGLYEIRIEYQSNIYRIFCCFDEGNLVILFNGFHKKTQKKPKKVIEKAERLKKKYFETKK